MLDWPEREHYTAEDLIEILRILRDPETGCPWDRVQTHQSIRKNFLEETYEALEALDADDPAMLREELGDVLMRSTGAGSIMIRSEVRYARSWCTVTRTSLPPLRRKMPV